jgi:hypothetical protein
MGDSLSFRRLKQRQILMLDPAIATNVDRSHEAFDCKATPSALTELLN